MKDYTLNVVCGKYRHKLSIYLETISNETLGEVPHGSMKVVLNGEDGHGEGIKVHVYNQVRLKSIHSMVSTYP